MGAINKITNEYSSPSFAKKTNNYQCPDCNADVVLRQGNINRHHFAHKSLNNCSYYDHPSESDIHKEAKNIIKSKLDNKQSINIYSQCTCGYTKSFNLDKYEGKAMLEYRFDFNGLKIADVALVGDITYMFEIYHTHKTREEKRPEPWFEFDAIEVILNSKTQAICNIRYFECDECKKKIEDKRIYLELQLQKEVEKNHQLYVEREQKSKELREYNFIQDKKRIEEDIKRKEENRKETEQKLIKLKEQELKDEITEQKRKEEYAKNMKLYESYGIITDPAEIERYAKADKSNKNDAEYMAKRITKEQYEKNKIKIGFVL